MGGTRLVEVDPRIVVVVVLVVVVVVVTGVVFVAVDPVESVLPRTWIGNWVMKACADASFRDESEFGWKLDSTGTKDTTVRACTTEAIVPA